LDKCMPIEQGFEWDISLLYLKDIDRGDLKWPSQFLTDIVLKIYFVFQTLISEQYEQKFLASKNGSHVIFAKSTEMINAENCTCECGVTIPQIVSKCVLTASNMMLNNYTKIVNDNDKRPNSKYRLTQQRKYYTFKS
jgi:hypothetical protein